MGAIALLDDLFSGPAPFEAPSSGEHDDLFSSGPIVPVTLESSGGSLIGFAERFDASRAEIQSLTGTMPAVDEECAATFDLDDFQAEARAKVVRRDPDSGRLTVEITRISGDGDRFLAFLLQNGEFGS